MFREKIYLFIILIFVCVKHNILLAFLDAFLPCKLIWIMLSVWKGSLHGRRDQSVRVLVLSLVPCAISSAAKGDQSVTGHGLVLGVDAGSSCYMRTPWWKQSESTWTDSAQSFTPRVVQFNHFSWKIPIYAPTAFLFWEMGTCHVGEKRDQ